MKDFQKIKEALEALTDAAQKELDGAVIKSVEFHDKDSKKVQFKETDKLLFNGRCRWDSVRKRIVCQRP